VSGDDEFENEERLPVLLIAFRIALRGNSTGPVQARLEDLTNMDYKLGFDEISKRCTERVVLGLGKGRVRVREG
jgi:hypothetical protein